MWSAAAHHPELLKVAVRTFVPSVSEFLRIKSQFLNGIMMATSPEGIVHIAVDKIAIQQMSYSGLGPMAGGPLGGWSQVNGGIDSRWNAENICRKIDLLSPYLRQARITNLDFSVLLTEGSRSLVYLDPPFFGVSDSLYQYSFSEVDHRRFMKSLRHSEHDWLLSCNDRPEIRELCAFSHMERIDAVYSASKQRTHELLISPPDRNRTIVGYNPVALAAWHGIWCRVRSRHRPQSQPCIAFGRGCVSVVWSFVSPVTHGF